MIDSHCHLDHEPLYSNISDVIKRSKENGLKKILTISTLCFSPADSEVIGASRSKGRLYFEEISFSCFCKFTYDISSSMPNIKLSLTVSDSKREKC